MWELSSRIDGQTGADDPSDPSLVRRGGSNNDQRNDNKPNDNKQTNNKQQPA